MIITDGGSLICQLVHKSAFHVREVVEEVVAASHCGPAEGIQRGEMTSNSHGGSGTPNHAYSGGTKKKATSNYIGVIVTVINTLASARRMTLQAKGQPVGDASPFKCD